MSHGQPDCTLLPAVQVLKNSALVLALLTCCNTLVGVLFADCNQRNHLLLRWLLLTATTLDWFNQALIASIEFAASLNSIFCFLSMASLHEAAFQGDPSVVQQLLDIGELVAAVDTEGRTSLHSAARAGHDSVMQLLLARGASVHAADTKRRTPLAMQVLGRVPSDVLSTVLSTWLHGLCSDTGAGAAAAAAPTGTAAQGQGAACS
jgi:hypothetical protein